MRGWRLQTLKVVRLTSFTVPGMDGWTCCARPAWTARQAGRARRQSVLWGSLGWGRKFSSGMDARVALIEGYSGRLAVGGSSVISLLDVQSGVHTVEFGGRGGEVALEGPG